MKAIAVVDKNWGIGCEGKLLVHIPRDLKYFKDKTVGKVVVMGRRTLESLPGGKPLPGRKTVVLTKNREFDCECETVHSIDEVLDKYGSEDVFIAGGEEVYRAFLPYCDMFLITKIDAEFDADKHFENLDQSDEYEFVSEDEPIEENGVSYRFTQYRRVR